MSRLEEIKTQLDRFMTPPSKPCLFRDDAEYLIDQAQKAEELQAKVDELEGEIEGLLQTLEDKEPYYSNLCLILEKQNQRYKQALEESYSELQKLYSRTDIPGNADIKDVLSTLEYVGLSVIKKALKGVEGFERD